MGANGEVVDGSVLKMAQSRKALKQLIAQWNANRLDLFEISEPNEDGEFQGVMRFYFQEAGAKVATKCVRISSTATTKAVIETLVEKFRPDMRMLSIPQYALYEIHENGEERRLGDQERPLFVQLNWHSDDREGRFLLKRIDEQTNTIKDTPVSEGFKRKLSKREKKQMKKLQEKKKTENASAAKKLYTELPETSFTRSISNPEAVMRRRRQQQLEQKLAQFRSCDGGPDTGGTLKIYGQSLCEDVPYKTLLLSVNDTAVYVVKEMLAKYGLTNQEPQNYCLVQVCEGEGESILDDDESPLSILMNQPNDRGSIMFHVRRRPPDYHPRKRKKKPGRRAEEEALSGYRGSYDGQLEPLLIELLPDGSETGRRIALESDVTEVGSEWGGLQLAGLRPRHCVIANTEGIVTLTPSSRDSDIYVNGQRIYETSMLQHGAIIRFGRTHYFRFSQRGSPGMGRSFSEREVIESPSIAGGISKGGSITQSPPVSPSQDDTPRTIRPDSILPATLELPEAGEEAFLSLVVVSVSPATLQFKLSPTYAIYLAARYRATTHFRSDATPHERAHLLSAFLVRIAHLMLQTVQDRNSDANSLAFWMANSSELLHFLKSDRQIGAFSIDAQDILAEVVQLSFRHLVTCIQGELSNLVGFFFMEREDEDENATSPILAVLGSTMTLLRRSRVNAALTIQLFSQVFHFINMAVFNKLIGMDGRNYCTRVWGNRLRRRLNRIETWAEKQGLELAADCHLVRVIQATHLLSALKNTPDEVATAASSCFKLNSMQLRSLLMKYQYEADEVPIAPEILENVIRVAESTVDDVIRADGRHIRVEEEPLLGLAFLLPEDGYSCDIVRGIPTGIVEFLSPLSPVCRLTPNPNAAGYWTIFFHDPMRSMSPSAMSGRSFAAAFNNITGSSGHVGPQTPGSVMSDRQSIMSHNMSNLNVPMSMSSTSMMSPNQNVMGGGGGGFSSNYLMPPNAHPARQYEAEIQTIKLQKISGGLGLSIVATKAAGQEKSGIYIKSVVKNGSADLDGRLATGDQLLTVDGQSLVGIPQEEAAKYLVRTGPIVTLEVAKQAAVYQGIASMLNQPSPEISRGKGDGQDLNVLDDGDDEASTDDDIELDVNDIAVLMDNSPQQKNNICGKRQQFCMRKQDALRCIDNELLTFKSSNNASNTNYKGTRKDHAFTNLTNTNTPDGGSDLVDSSYWSSIYSGSLGGGGGGFIGPSGLNGTGFYNIRPSHSDSALARWSSFEALSRKGVSESALGVPRIVGSSRLLKFFGNPIFYNHDTANNSSSDNSPSGFNASRRMSERDLPSKMEFTDPSAMAHLPAGHPLLQPRIHSSKSVPSLNSDQGPQPTTVVQPMVRSPGHPGSIPHGHHDASSSHSQRYAQHYPSASMTMQHSSKAGHVPGVNNMEMQHPRSRSIQSLSDPPYRPEIGNKQPSTPSLHTHQAEEPERFYQNVGFYPPPPPSNPANMPIRTYIPYSNSAGNISSSAGFRSPSGINPTMQYPGSSHPQPRQAPPNLNTSMPGNLNWSRTNPANNPGVNRDLLRQEAKMLEMQDELRRREERAAIMMSKAQQNYPLRYAHQQSRAAYPSGQRPLSTSGPPPAPKPYRPGELVEMPPGRPPLPDEYKHQSQFSASMGEIPKGAFSYNNGIIPKSPSVPANPWDREAKEVEAIRKKEAAKYWRDQQIRELEILPHRTPSQDEQLRALKLEKEFQRRAAEMKKDDDGENDEEEEEQDERKAMIRRLQQDLEKTRISSNGSKLDPMEEERARKIEEMRRKKLELEAAQAAEERLVREATKRREEELKRQMQQHSFPYQSPYRTSFPPKLASPTTNSSTGLNENHHLSPTMTNAPPLPKSPPPTFYRGQQHATTSSPERPSVSPPQTSKPDKKSVSFNETVATNEPPSPEPEEPTEKVREDPNKFFESASAMLSSPRSPDATPGGSGMTPGVIGAQEVYRDPRMRRLAEQQQKQQATPPKPEKLTFKEKMKMFAMESGEVETPKDKVKTSSKQREIETVPPHMTVGK